MRAPVIERAAGDVGAGGTATGMSRGSREGLSGQAARVGLRADVGVVGAGPGGLATAVLLAARGARVTVYEREATIGGRSARITLPAPGGGQYHFDRGPTFFLMPYVLEEIFAAAGRRLADVLELHRLDPMYRLIIGRHGGGKSGAARAGEGGPFVIDTTQDIAEMARRLSAVFPARPDGRGQGEGFERFIAHNRAKLGLSEQILRRPIRSLLDLLDPKHLSETLAVAPLLKPHKTVHQMLGEFFTDEHAKLAVSFQSKYLGMSPFDCPSLFTILPFIEYEYGVWHPVGGCNAIMRGLAGVARELGVAFRTSSAVQSLTFERSGGTPRATGVIVGGPEGRGDAEAVSHDAVVVNADATWAIKSLIPPELRTGSRASHADAALDRKRYSCSTYMLYLGLDGAVEHLPHHTIYTSARYRENLHDIAGDPSAGGGRATLDDPSVYVCNPTRLDPSLAPAGKSAMYVLVPVSNTQTGRDNTWGNGTASALREVTLNQLERVFGIRDVRRRIEAEHAITPVDWQAMNINHGATFNLAHNLGQMLHWRPQNKLNGFEGVYLTGGGTHPGSGLPTIFLSAQIAAGLVSADVGGVAAR